LRLSLIHSNSTVFTRWGEQQTAWRRDAKPFYLYQRHGLAACGVFLGKRGERRGQRAALTIAGRAISSLIQTQGLGDLGGLERHVISPAGVRPSTASRATTGKGAYLVGCAKSFDRFKSVGWISVAHPPIQELSGCGASALFNVNSGYYSSQVKILSSFLARCSEGLQGWCVYATNAARTLTMALTRLR